MAKLVGLVVLFAAHLAPPGVSAEDRPTTVVFVCEHGSAKSMIAALWFNRLASEQGLPLQGVSRGVNPDAKVGTREVERYPTGFGRLPGVARCDAPSLGNPGGGASAKAVCRATSLSEAQGR